MKPIFNQLNQQIKQLRTPEENIKMSSGKHELV